MGIRLGIMRCTLVLVAGIAPVTVAPPALATTVRHLEARDLTLESSDIVIGSVVGVHSRWNASHTKILTDVTIHVVRTLKGTNDESLTLTQLGGEVDGARYSVPGSPVFTPGEEALFFVWRDSQGRRQVNGLAQGKFEIRRDAVTGEQLVQRALPGLAVQDAKRLGPVRAGQTAPKIPLAELVREIELTLTAERAR